jgi:hypothetical protein
MTARGSGERGQTGPFACKATNVSVSQTIYQLAVSLARGGITIYWRHGTRKKFLKQILDTALSRRRRRQNCLLPSGHCRQYDNSS